MEIINRLKVARRAHEFTLELYEATSVFPRSEQYGLTSQLRRAAVSIGSNIAEGDAHHSPKVFLRHLLIALSSAGEVAYQLRLALDLGMVEPERYDSLESTLGETRGMIIGLISHLRTRASPS